MCAAPADIEAAVAEGRCLKADTLDELLAKIDGMNAQVAKESIERYNQLAKAGSDEDFGKSSQRMFALENGPFYAAECGVALTLANLGGLESDSDCHVYNTERQVISGLYGRRRPAGRALQRAVPHLAQGPVRRHVHGVRQDRRRERRCGQVGGCHDRREQGCGNRFRR